jgi:hypothetical protein
VQSKEERLLSLEVIARELPEQAQERAQALREELARFRALEQEQELPEQAPERAQAELQQPAAAQAPAGLRRQLEAEPQDA